MNFKTLKGKSENSIILCILSWAVVMRANYVTSFEEG